MKNLRFQLTFLYFRYIITINKYLAGGKMPEDNSDKVVFKRVIITFPPSPKRYFIMTKSEMDKVFALAKIRTDESYIGPYTRFEKF